MAIVTNSTIRKECTIELFCKLNTQCSETLHRKNYFGIHKLPENRINGKIGVDNAGVDVEKIITTNTERNILEILSTTIENNYYESSFSSEKGNEIDGDDSSSSATMLATNEDKVTTEGYIKENINNTSNNMYGTGSRTGEESDKDSSKRDNMKSLHLNETELKNKTVFVLAEKQTNATNAVIITAVTAGTVALMIFGAKSVYTLMQSGAYGELFFPD